MKAAAPPPPPPPPKPLPTGFIGQLTEREAEVLAEVKNRFGVQATIDAAFASDMVLLKFCRARDFNLDKVTELLTRHFQWRTKPLFSNPSAKMGALSSTPVMELHATGPSASIQTRIPSLTKFYPTGYHGTTKSGQPLYIDCVGKIDAGGLFSVATEEEIIEYFISECERRDCTRFAACSLAAGRLIENSVAVIDLSSLSFRLCTHSMIRKLIKYLSAVNQDHYPETLHRMLIVNAPRVFSLAWSFVKPLLDEKTLDKISIYGDDFLPALRELVEEENIPRYLGGRCSCGQGHVGATMHDCLAADIGPWRRPDLQRVLAEHHWTEVQSVAFLERWREETASNADAGAAITTTTASEERPDSRTSGSEPPQEVVHEKENIVCTPAAPPVSLSTPGKVGNLVLEEVQLATSARWAGPPAKEDVVTSARWAGPAAPNALAPDSPDMSPGKTEAAEAAGNLQPAKLERENGSVSGSSGEVGPQEQQRAKPAALDANLLAHDHPSAAQERKGIAATATDPSPQQPGDEATFDSPLEEANGMGSLLHDIMKGESPSGFRSVNYEQIGGSSSSTSSSAAASPQPARNYASPISSVSPSPLSNPAAPLANSNAPASNLVARLGRPPYLPTSRMPAPPDSLSPRSQSAGYHTDGGTNYYSDYASDGAYASARGESSDASSLTPSSERGDVIDDWRNAHRSLDGAASSPAGSPLTSSAKSTGNYSDDQLVVCMPAAGSSSGGFRNAGAVAIGKNDNSAPAGTHRTSQITSVGNGGDAPPSTSAPSTTTTSGDAKMKLPANALLMQEFDVLLTELANLESRHMDTLRNWGRTQDSLMQETPEHSIERAAKYYDAFFARKDSQDEVSSLTHEFQQLSAGLEGNFAEVESYRKRLQKLQQYGTVKVETSPGGEYFPPGEEEKHLANCLQQLKDSEHQHVARKLAIEQRLGEALAELKTNQGRFDVLAAPHWYCSWNCSVVRAKRYYTTKREHEQIVESEMRQIESVHKRLRAVKILRRRAEITSSGSSEGVQHQAGTSAGRDILPQMESREGLEKKLFEIESLMGAKRNKNEEEYWSCDDLG